MSAGSPLTRRFERLGPVQRRMESNPPTSSPEVTMLTAARMVASWHVGGTDDAVNAPSQPY